jgi:hypothetical protein
VGHLKAASSALRIGLIADLVQLLQCPGWLSDQPEGEPPPDNWRRQIAYGSRLANGGDLIRSSHHTNGSGFQPVKYLVVLDGDVSALRELCRVHVIRNWGPVTMDRCRLICRLRRSST